MGTKNQFCINNHDVFIFGRDSSGNCKLCKKIYSKNSYQTYGKHYYQMHKIKIRKLQKQYNQAHKNRHNIRIKQRRTTDINYKLAFNARTRLRIAIKSNQRTGSAVQDLGCTIPELKEHLEKQFKDGMNWNNWGNGTDKWNIDHIIPLSSFDLTKRKQFLKAVNYKNLQPLWGVDNLRKGKKL